VTCLERQGKPAWPLCQRLRQHGQAWPRVDARRKVTRNQVGDSLLSGVESEDAADRCGSAATRRAEEERSFDPAGDDFRLQFEGVCSPPPSRSPAMSAVPLIAAAGGEPARASERLQCGRDREFDVWLQPAATAASQSPESLSARRPIGAGRRQCCGRPGERPGSNVFGRPARQLIQARQQRLGSACAELGPGPDLVG
jgi:hypothetical protein